MNELKERFDYGPWGQQFCPPFSYELAGKKLDIRFDSQNAVADFLDREKVSWKYRGIDQTADYWALKLTDDIFMVSFGIVKEICVTLILDMKERLVTLDETSFDENQSPYKSALEFGAIEMPGYPLPEKRHYFTKELAGNCFKWVFCDTYWHAEGYLEDNMFYYSNYPDFKGIGPYRAIKISDTVYYSCNGDSKESMSCLMDMSKLISVSRSVVYGNNGKAIPMGAVGAFEDDASAYGF